MKCIKCLTKNIYKADYCQNCGYHFSKKEKKAARRTTLIGKIELIEEAYAICTLKKFTGHTLFKIATILIVLFIGLYFTFSKDNTLKILDNDYYLIQYNTKKSEYYLITNENEVPLDLYLPNGTTEIKIQHLDKSQAIISEDAFTLNDSITLKTNSNQDYYLINTDNEEQLKVTVYLSDYIEVQHEN